METLEYTIVMVFSMHHNLLKELFVVLVNFIEVELIYSLVLISTVQQSDSVIHMYTFCWASLVAQTVKRLSTMRETRV